MLALVAVADGHIDTPERRFLRRVGKVLGREVDLAAIDRLSVRVRAGEHPAGAATAAYAT